MTVLNDTHHRNSTVALQQRKALLNTMKATLWETRFASSCLMVEAELLNMLGNLVLASNVAIMDIGLGE